MGGASLGRFRGRDPMRIWLVGFGGSGEMDWRVDRDRTVETSFREKYFNSEGVDGEENSVYLIE